MTIYASSYRAAPLYTQPTFGKKEKKPTAKVGKPTPETLIIGREYVVNADLYTENVDRFGKQYRRREHGTENHLKKGDIVEFVTPQKAYSEKYIFKTPKGEHISILSLPLLDPKPLRFKPSQLITPYPPTNFKNRSPISNFFYTRIYSPLLDYLKR